MHRDERQKAQGEGSHRAASFSFRAPPHLRSAPDADQPPGLGRRPPGARIGLRQRSDMQRAAPKLTFVPITYDHRGNEVPGWAREDSMRKPTCGALVVALALATMAAPAAAEDLLVTQYRADPSGAPYGVALAKGFFAKAGVNITGIISGDGGGASVRSAMASDLGYGDVSPAPAIAAIEAGVAVV
jgi:hypothetical protein